MRKLTFLPCLLLAILMTACRISATPGSTAAPVTVAPEPVAPANALTVQDPQVSDPQAGQAKFRLLELGYDICTITTDYYNYQTEAAVRQFQLAAGLEAHGALDPLTLERLLAADAPAQPTPSPVALTTNEIIYLESGEALVAASGSFWALQGGYFVQFSGAGDFLGFFLVQPLPGEEDYLPAAFAYDGVYLWIAQQGPTDAIVQAYDPKTADPVDGLLQPSLPASIHFPSMQIYAAAADNGTIWFLTDDLQSIFLQPVDALHATAGTPMRVGQSSGFGYGYGIAPDPAGVLWVSYADEIFGEQAILRVNPATGTVGPALGPCGMRVTYALSRLWFVNPQGLWSFDPASGERVLYDYPADGQTLFAAESGSLWLLDPGGTLVGVAIP